ncbi:hypothetical protein ACF0H5_007044 [Mactra antiquata]
MTKTADGKQFDSELDSENAAKSGGRKSASGAKNVSKIQEIVVRHAKYTVPDITRIFVISLLSFHCISKNNLNYKQKICQMDAAAASSKISLTIVQNVSNI